MSGRTAIAIVYIYKKKLILVRTVKLISFWYTLYTYNNYSALKINCHKSMKVYQRINSYNIILVETYYLI